ncbi:hypothetical protein C9374_011390 [Naegleria lovaniensis]|uniref:Uncharacterized protein n=1 Tax=Naegleria lovaniensis TaxID=51637 RepID=A0AA88KWN7_NAELO|nr:uncharacterized protein C9374_011390 [Naegleria lovaniensis]KAG2392665.1 hypothetical protein C9374_011390 [Naegleria lovaniensis]
MGNSHHSLSNSNSSNTDFSFSQRTELDPNKVNFDHDVIFPILAIGDSICKGCYRSNMGTNSEIRFHPFSVALTTLINEKFKTLPKCKVYEFGRVEETTFSLTQRLLRFLQLQNIYEDQCLHSRQGYDNIPEGYMHYRYRTIETIVNTIKDMSEQCLQQPSVSWVAICSIPSSKKDVNMNILSKKVETNEMIQHHVNEFNSMLNRKNSKRLIYVDITTPFYYLSSTPQDIQKYWSDDLLFTPEGYDKIAEIIFHSLQSHFSQHLSGTQSFFTLNEYDNK